MASHAEKVKAAGSVRSGQLSKVWVKQFLQIHARKCPGPSKPILLLLQTFSGLVIETM